MTLIETFIRRPVATSLLTVGVALGGGIAFRLLPVAPLPQVDFPTISVSASVSGASPEVMAATVATPLERALGRIAGVTELTSNSSQGSSRVTLQFDMSRDINGAARDVQAAINAARSLLPTSLVNNPSYRKANPADFPILILSLTSDQMSRGDMYDAATTILGPRIAQLEGVGDVSVGGGALPAVRVELNPAQLSNYGISMDTVRAAISSTNANQAKGFVELGDRRWQIAANDQALRASDYIPLIISYRKGAPIRLGDVADVSDSVENLRTYAITNGVPSVLIQINRQPEANIIDTVDRIKAMIPALQASIPSSIKLAVSADRSVSIRATLRDVELSLVGAVVLVTLVVFLFLRDWRATLIPAVAVPVSLISGFAAMHLAGFSLNNLSLMALTVATCFVVDDAIVVLENISRHVEEGMPRFQAAIVGAREVGFTVLSMSLALIAVFIPILLMGGIVGRLFREFAVTLSVTIIISLLISLTTTPMMCARLISVRPKKTAGSAKHGVPATGFFARAVDAYGHSLNWVLQHSLLMVFVLVAIIGLNVYLYVAIPKSFFPPQDTGMLQGGVNADQSMSFAAMLPKVEAFAKIVQEDPAVDTVTASAGGGGGRGPSGGISASLKPIRERKVTGDEVVTRLRSKTIAVSGAQLFLNVNQDLRAGGRMSDSSIQYTLQADDLAELVEWEPKIRNAFAQIPLITDVSTDNRSKGLQSTLIFDRDKISLLGLSMSQIDSALYNSFGQRQVSTLFKALNQYHVVMEVDPQFAQGPTALSDVFVIGRSGAKIPISTFSRYVSTNAPLSVNHQGQFVSSTISFNLVEGVTLSQAAQAIDFVMANLGVPTSVHGSFEGSARMFQQALDNQPVLILTALIAVYIVLGVLYESYIHPITILSSLPSAGVGALLALRLFGADFSIIALIGVLLLIGLVQKNAIMMIDVALTLERAQHLTPRAAIFKACLLRFRPITMTTSSALLGALPLAIGFGEGSELRRPLGIAIVGGLVFSQALTLYTTPVVYLYFDRYRLWLERRRAARRSLRAAGTATPAKMFS